MLCRFTSVAELKALVASVLRARTATQKNEYVNIHLTHDADLSAVKKATLLRLARSDWDDLVAELLAPGTCVVPQPPVRLLSETHAVFERLGGCVLHLPRTTRAPHGRNRVVW